MPVVIAVCAIVFGIFAVQATVKTLRGAPRNMKRDIVLAMAAVLLIVATAGNAGLSSAVDLLFTVALCGLSAGLLGLIVSLFFTSKARRATSTPNKNAMPISQEWHFAKYLTHTLLFLMGMAAGLTISQIPHRIEPVLLFSVFCVGGCILLLVKRTLVTPQ